MKRIRRTLKVFKKKKLIAQSKYDYHTSKDETKLFERAASTLDIPQSSLTFIIEDAEGNEIPQSSQQAA